MPVNTLIQIRKGTSSDWTSTNPVLGSGEPGFVTDQSRLKIGDGTTDWQNLNYIGSNESLYQVRNETGSVLYAGQSVYASGIHANKVISPNLFTSNNSIPDHMFMGLITNDINNNNFGYVTHFGQINGLNTTGSLSNISAGSETWINGTLLYASPSSAGKLTSTKPTEAVLVAIVLYAHATQGKLFVRPTMEPHLDDLHDVNVSGSTNGQFLQYNAASGAWIASSSGNFTGLSINNNSNIVTGTGVANHVAYWNSSSGIVADSGQLVWDSTNNRLGIGISTPSVSLEIGGDLNVGYANENVNRTITVHSSNASNKTGKIRHDGSSFILDYGVGNQSFSLGTSASRWANGIAYYGGSHLFYGNNGSNTILTINNSTSGVSIGSGYNVNTPTNGLIVEGNVGIGTTSPSGQLHVIGSGIFNSGIYVNNIGITGNMVFATNASGNLIIKPNGDGSLQADNGGNSRGLYSVDLQRSRASVSGVAAGNYSVVAGGNNNRAGGPGCTVAGGTNNTCDSNSYNTIGGGFGNTAVGGSSTIAGGVLNTASGYLSTIGGGESNTSSAYRSTVSGGQSNTASGYYSVVSGGKNNTASNLYSTVSGGVNNTASSYRSTVGGGTNNTSSGDRSVIGGGESNTSSGTWSTVGGGGSNTASNNYATVAGGYTNNASESTSTVGGGAFNTASAYMSTVSGGKNNTASGIASTVGGGGHNLSSGVASTITGGIEGVSHQHGEEARSSGKFVDNGDAQIRKLLMRGKTTIANNTVLLTLDGALETVPSNNSVLSHNRYDPNDSTKQYTWLYNIKVIARNLSSAAPESAAYKFEGILESSSSAGVILLGNTKTVIYEDNADFDCNIYEYNTASGSINDGLYIEVSNSVYTQDEDIYWLAYVEILEIGITEYENSVYY